MNNIREYLLVLCERQLNPDDKNLAELERLQKYFLEIRKPHSFDPGNPDNVISNSENQLIEMLNTMEDNGTFDPKGLTEYEFYQKVIYLKKKFKAMAGEK